jgi:hypothetical protein
MPNSVLLTIMILTLILSAIPPKLNTMSLLLIIYPITDILGPVHV